ncbi:related to FRE1 - ferric (and cupric) reductase [Cephalotrichum gorgonifer]|uniref:Related to FRE1 - ferric (And cupric) reductase n=1 Tax=Cephalotrichum gorgonifer TaxID=2041049 RepID=A0AAE8SXC7_9PEZI|nr:related to FRE1 - ferric (and cupric) reductase [Cephalotrichum gorgonifer]
MTPVRGTLASRLLIALYALGVQGDGTGLIGWGKTLYNPTCCFACRGVIKNQQLLCTPVDSTENHGTTHNPVTTPPDCFVQDPSFLKTMALCIDTYCALSDDPPMSLIEDYWVSHLGTGTLGDYQYVPAMPYHEALSAAREDESHAALNTNSTAGNETSHDHMNMRRLKARQHGSGASTEDLEINAFDVSSPLPMAAGGRAPLNVTSFVDPEAWQLQHNYMSDFETNEAGHSTMSIVIAIVAIFLPIGLSLIRYIPGLTKNRGWSYIQSMAIYPSIWRKKHREPVAGVLVPTRGQAMYIFLISILNIILLLAPYVITQPQASFISRDMQTLSIIGNRAGSMAMGNVVALFLFAARNNVLFYVSDWSYGTYILLHRWLGYWAVFHTILHSFMLMANYMVLGTYQVELARLYWVWGIVGTVAASAILPFSLLWVRQKFYELFLASHIVLALLFIIGYYYHIWYCYEYKWGYEIWMFIAGGIWGADRVLRLARMAFHGSCTAVITAIEDSDGEYFRIDVQGKHLKHGVAYLTFPTLGWRFWESHPFSVALQNSGADDGERESTPPSDENTEDPEKSTGKSQVAPAASPSASSGKHATTTFFTRSRTGITKKLAARISGGAGSSTRLRILIDGPYDHSGRVSSQLAQCTGVLYIAGGVGITACLPYIAQSGAKDSKLFWSVRQTGLATALEPTLAALPSNVRVETTVGQRLDLDALLGQEMVGAKNEGPLAIVVCGPPGMADDVRQKVVSFAKANVLGRPYVLLDEAFSW